MCNVVSGVVWLLNRFLSPIYRKNNNNFLSNEDLDFVKTKTKETA